MRRTRFAVMLIVFAVGAAPVFAQQEADPNFDTRVAHPAFTDRHPRVSVDEAHHNFHTMSGRYMAFAKLVASDGCVVSAGKQRFTGESLARTDILVIANALGDDRMADPAASRPAFTPAECAAVRSWVEKGGALLLIADHSPMGSAARNLGEALGVDLRSSYTIDTVQAAMGPAIIAYTTERGLATGHPIVRGRDSSETIHRVVTFAGESLSGPPGATQLLTLSDKAEDLMVGMGQAGPQVARDQRQSAAGRAQGLAFELGKGRVVVLGEAAMMSAQVFGPQKSPIGMNLPGTDDRQFALNVVRWLGRAL